MFKSPVLVRTLDDLRRELAAHRLAGRTIGFVPTMGALHDGHISLVEKAREASDITVTSIFVNPTQFAPGEDLDTYPRTEEADIGKLRSVGCDIVYLPTVEEMYPDGSLTNIRVCSCTFNPTSRCLVKRTISSFKSYAAWCVISGSLSKS